MKIPRALAPSPALPNGPVELAEFGRMMAVRCPRELAHIMQHAGGVWEPGSRRWLVAALGRDQGA
jgi:hypothetical protein